MVSTRNPSLIWSAGIQSLNGNILKNHATISVEEDIITWESSHDKCVFSTQTPTGIQAPASPPCTRCLMQSAPSSSALPHTNLTKTTDIQGNPLVAEHFESNIVRVV